MMALQEFTRTL